MARTTLDIDLNRVEGDLAFQVDMEGNTIVDARCIGTMFRGFEQLLIGRAPKDGLVITPRVCGICSTAHLHAAVTALERLGNLPVPAHATIVRNLCLMAENVQSDIRQTFLFFVPDFLHARYAGHAMAQEVAAAFAPMQGTVVRSALQVTRRLVEIVAIFGGQWPHSSYMIPGGVTKGATVRELIDCQTLVDEALCWYEDVLLGDKLDNFLALSTAEELLTWLEAPRHASSALGVFTRFARDVGLQRTGAGSPHFLSAGAYYEPGTWSAPYGEARTLHAAGVYDGAAGALATFDQAQVNEHVRHSWYRPYEGGRHPYAGETVPDYQPDSDRYTWAKAPRYGEQVVETGPLAELLAAGDALLRDLIAREGPSTWLRQFARLRRAGRVLALMKSQLAQLGTLLDAPHYEHPADGALDAGEGFGFVQAARGTLGHWIQTEGGKISRYQIVTPTAWNASPRDSAGRPGHWEQSVIGLELADPADPLELGHVIRSHDPCLVCTVHFTERGSKVRYGV